MLVQITRNDASPITVMLLTAADRYDPSYYGSGSNLRFCVSDAKKFMAYGLIKEGDVQIIEIYDHQMTKVSVVETLESILGQLTSGDLFVWYQSSHGTYFDTKENGATVRMTGRCMHSHGTGGNSAVLWDRELIPVWSKIPAGVTVMTISDSCYSESQNRNVRQPIPGVEYQEARHTETTMPPLVPTNGKLSLKRGAGIIEISASTFKQTSLEVKYSGNSPKSGGVFTEAFVNPGISTSGNTIIQHFLATRRAMPASIDQTPTIAFHPKSGNTFNRMKNLIV